MNVPITFVSGADVAISPDAALVSIHSPAGAIQDGRIQTVECARLVMSHRTLRELARLFAAKVQELPPVQPARLAARPEPRSFDRREDADEPAPGPLPGVVTH